MCWSYIAYTGKDSGGSKRATTRGSYRCLMCEATCIHKRQDEAVRL